MSEIGKSIETERQKSSLTVQREEEGETGYRYWVSFKEDENVLKLDYENKIKKKKLDYGGTSLAVKWLRLCLAMQGVWVGSLAEESQCRGCGFDPWLGS